METKTNRNDLYIGMIVANSPCGRHSAMRGMACFRIRKDNGQDAIGVCDFRAKKFFNGKITAASVTTKGRAARLQKTGKR